MAGRRQQQQPLSPPQLQAILIAVADAVMQALLRSSQQGVAPQAASVSASAGGTSKYSLRVCDWPPA